MPWQHNIRLPRWVVAALPRRITAAMPHALTFNFLLLPRRQARLEALQAACKGGAWKEQLSTLPSEVLGRQLAAWPADYHRVEYLTSSGELSAPLAEVIGMTTIEFAAAHPGYEAWLAPKLEAAKEQAAAKRHATAAAAAKAE